MSDASLDALADTAASRLDAARRAAVDAFAEREGIDARIVATADHSPNRLERFLRFYEEAGVEPFGERRLKDVLHARVAELDELTRRHELPADAADIPLPAGLADDERALVRFADAFAVDHHAIPDAVHVDLRKHFDDARLTELLWTLAIARGLARVGAVVGVPFR